MGGKLNKIFDVEGVHKQIVIKALRLKLGHLGGIITQYSVSTEILDICVLQLEKSPTYEVVGVHKQI